MAPANIKSGSHAPRIFLLDPRVLLPESYASSAVSEFALQENHEICSKRKRLTLQPLPPASLPNGLRSSIEH
jgi:hypothetical protein